MSLLQEPAGTPDTMTFDVVGSGTILPDGSNDPTLQSLQLLHAARYMHQYRSYSDMKTTRIYNCVTAGLGVRDGSLAKDSLRSWWTRFADKLDDEDCKQQSWARLQLDGLVFPDEPLPREFEASARHLREVAGLYGETDLATLRLCISEYIKQGRPSYRGYGHLVRCGRWEELKARVDNDEAMLDARLGALAMVLGKPLRGMIRQMRVQYGLDHLI